MKETTTDLPVPRVVVLATNRNNNFVADLTNKKQLIKLSLSLTGSTLCQWQPPLLIAKGTGKQQHPANINSYIRTYSTLEYRLVFVCLSSLKEVLPDWLLSHMFVNKSHSWMGYQVFPFVSRMFLFSEGYPHPAVTCFDRMFTTLQNIIATSVLCQRMLFLKQHIAYCITENSCIIFPALSCTRNLEAQEGNKRSAERDSNAIPVFQCNSLQRRSFCLTEI